MKRISMCLMMFCLVFLCGYNEQTGNGCTHHHDRECGYENNQCEHSLHMIPGIEPRVDRGGEV